ncbi:MAG: hypothetical protein HC869_07155 [Rhodospirillales bacterium]|nr:hypothetical protein [Rhodospirillales bacterium]
MPEVSRTSLVATNPPFAMTIHTGICAFCVEQCLTHLEEIILGDVHLGNIFHNRPSKRQATPVIRHKETSSGKRKSKKATTGTILATHHTSGLSA